MATSDRAAAIEAGWKALASKPTWRNWGVLTITRRVVNGMEEAGFEIVRKSDLNDGPGVAE